MPTYKGGPPDLTGLNLEKKVEALENSLIELNRKLSWMMSKLDSKNVKRLDTNETSIKSADGETIINGPVLEMYDKQAVPVLRLKQGYDSASGDFIYALYNEASSQTVGIDSNGNATFTGAISASTITGGTITGGAISGGTIDGTTITGGTIQTAATGRRIVLSGSELQSLNSSTKDGFTLDGVDGFLRWYNISGALTGILGRDTSQPYEQMLFSHNYLLLSGNNAININAPTINIGNSPGNTYAAGTWDFTGATTVTGLVNSTQADHNHGIPDGTVLAKDGGGTVTFSASGSHSHTINV